MRAGGEENGVMFGRVSEQVERDGEEDHDKDGWIRSRGG